MTAAPPVNCAPLDQEFEMSRRATLFEFRAIRRPGLLLAGLLLGGGAAMSVHVGLLAAGAPFPLPKPPSWVQWLNEAFITSGLLIVLKLAGPAMADRRVAARTAVAFLILAAIQETLRVGIMNGVVTGGWAYSAIGLIRPFIRALILSFLCAVAIRWARSVISLIMSALVIAAISTVARKFVAYALEPLVQHFAWLARPDLYAFPYPIHVTVAAYLTFAEAVAGATLVTMLIWDALPGSKPVRLLVIASLVALIKGVVGSTLLYSAFTGETLLLGVASWGQFVLEFLTLGALTGLAWDAFGRQHAPKTAGVQ